MRNLLEENGIKSFCEEMNCPVYEHIADDGCCWCEDHCPFTAHEYAEWLTKKQSS